MKYCKDCQHYHGPTVMLKPRCRLHSETRRSPVSGDLEFMTTVFCDAINTEGQCADYTAPPTTRQKWQHTYQPTNIDSRGLAAPDPKLLEPNPMPVPKWVQYLAAWCRALWAAVRKAYNNED